MFRKAKSSIETCKKFFLLQDQELRQQTEALHRIEARLDTPATGPTASKKGLPEDFDPSMYLLLNADIAAVGIDPTEHYLANGKNEGRKYSADWTYAQDGLFTFHNCDFQQDLDFMRAYARGLKANKNIDFNWQWRVHTGLWAARAAARLQGDFIECGVNRGFLSSAIMEDLNWNSLDRTFWLLDTFAGIDTDGVSSEDYDPGAKERNRVHFESGLYTSDVEHVRQNFAEWNNIEIVVGSVPGTLAKITSERIAFASVDMNSAPLEIAAIEFLWPRLVTGAVVLLDDYAYHGYLPQRIAMDNFAKRHGTSVLSLPTGQGLIIRPPN